MTLSSNLRVRNGALVLAAGVASPDGLSRTWQSLHRAREVCYAALGYKGFSIINCSFVPLEEYLFEVDCKFKFRTNICTNTLHSPSALIIQNASVVSLTISDVRKIYMFGIIR